jgi:hypothetical protein
MQDVDERHDMRHPDLFAAIAALALLPPAAAHANDAVGAIVAGGVVLRSERRIAMKKERLLVSQEKIRVEYEFVNESQDEVTTEVVFPIPEFGPDDYERYVVTDFTVSVDGRRIPVEKDVRAFLEGKDVTRALRNAGLDLAAWVSVPWVSDVPDKRQSLILRLPQAKLVELRQRGLLRFITFSRPGFSYPGLDEPQWITRISYHWTQRFPAGKVLRVEHEYSPGVGAEQGVQETSVKAACADPGLARALSVNPSGGTSLVKYILTTANTWKTPISDFELIVERPEDSVVSFCWDGPVQKIGKTTFRAAVENFVPKRELTVYFFSLPPAADGAARGDR